MGLSAPIALRLTDNDVESVRRSHHDKIVELQSLPTAAMVVISSVGLSDATNTIIAHHLGRAPIWIGPSAPRDAVSSGRIVEVRDSTVDRTRMIILKATGWGATITVDVAVM